MPDLHFKGRNFTSALPSPTVIAIKIQMLPTGGGGGENGGAQRPPFQVGGVCPHSERPVKT